MKVIFRNKLFNVFVCVTVMFFGNEAIAQSQYLPCTEPAVIGSGLGGLFWGSVCGCDGNTYATDTDAISVSGVTHLTNDVCGGVGCSGGHADFSYVNVGGGSFWFQDSSIQYPLGSFLWNFGDGTTSTTPDFVNHVYASSGFYLVTLLRYDSCSSTTGRVIYADVTSQITSFYVFLSGNNPNCISNGTLTATVYGGTPPFSYLWNNGATTQTITGLPEGNYSVVVTDDSGWISGGVHQLTAVCMNVIEGTVYNDVNGNCTYDSLELSLQQGWVMAHDALNFYNGYINSNGHYSIVIPTTGNFVIAVSPSSLNGCGNQSACAISNVSFSSMGDTAHSNIPIFQIAAFNLTTSELWTSIVPGSNIGYMVRPMNIGSSQYSGPVTIKFVYDSALIYQSSMPPLPVHDVALHTLTWQTNGLDLNQFPEDEWQNVFLIPSNYSGGIGLESDYSITPTIGDCNPSDNHFHIIATAPFDPNSKAVTPEGNITVSDSVLTYTIHFQNTGSDTTHFVILKDTLSQYLDPATVQNIASSAPYSDFTISGNGILTWTFNPLFLPDSSTNEPASKGFVMFIIKTRSSLPVGTTINNKASIYFDYNTPVVTNTATNSIISGVNEIEDETDIKIFPNPVNKQLTVISEQLVNAIEINDMLGRIVYSEQTNSQLSIINCQLFPAGVYFIKAQMQDGSVAVRKFVKD